MFEIYNKQTGEVVDTSNWNWGIYIAMNGNVVCVEHEYIACGLDPDKFGWRLKE